MGFLEGVKKTINNTAETLQKTADKLPDSVKDIDYKGAVNKIAESGSKAINTAVKEGAEIVNKTKESIHKKEKAANNLLTIEDALKVFYYMMHADGRLTAEEQDKFDLIGAEVDKLFSYHKANLLKECDENISKEVDPACYMDNLLQNTGDAIAHSLSSTEGEVPGILLVWNLLTIANSDSDYSQDEKRFIRFVIDKLGIEQSVLMEMENSLQTMIALETEENWLKSTNRPYAEIQKHLDEIAVRKETVMRSVKALMMD